MTAKAGGVRLAGQSEETMPDTVIQPPIPTAPVTPAVLEALRAIVGERGLILDEQGKQPFVTDWRGSTVGRAAVVVRPASTEEVSKVREALLRPRHRHRAAGRQHRPDGRRHAVADAPAASCCRSAA